MRDREAPGPQAGRSGGAPEAMILGAGFGKRLRPLTYLKAKPAIPFLNRPLVQHSFDLLRSAGVERVFLNLHHLPESVRAAVPDGFDVHFCQEPEILGTAGGVGAIRGRLSAQTLIISNGKIYSEQDLSQVLESHKKRGALATLVLRPHRSGYNPVFLDSMELVTGFGQPAPFAGWQTPTLFTGVHIWDRQVLDWIPEGFSDSVQTLYPKLIAARQPVMGFVSSEFWCETSWLEAYLDNSRAVLRRMGRTNLPESSGMPGCSGVIAAPGCRLGQGSTLCDSILWKDVRIGENCQIRHCVLTEGVELPPGASLADAVVTPVLDVPDAPVRRLGDFLVWPLSKTGGL